MTVEMLVRWTDFSVRKMPPEDGFMNLLGESEESQNFEAHPIFSYSPMTYDITDVKTFNKSQQEGHTTIRFANGDGYVIKLPYLQFAQIWSEKTGKGIDTYFPDDYEDPEEEVDDEDDLRL